MADVLSYRPRTGDIPQRPGVYRFLDERGRVLYVGKAKNLRSRLVNYFAPLHALHERTRAMVTSASDVQWTVVSNEIEALHLEYTWIKEFDPPFNVKFRDDKSYPMMAITLKDEAPRVFVTRNRNIRGARYFGPYPKVWAVNEAIELMIKVFPIRTCKPSDYERAMKTGKPCFAGQIGRCGGPCSHTVTIDEHRKMVDRFIAFMERYDRSEVDAIERRMREAADEHRFEDAAKYRDQMIALETVLEKSAVVLPERTDLDVIAVELDELAAAMQLFTVRGGRVRGVRSLTVDTELDVAQGELLQQSLVSLYSDDGLVPPAEIVVPGLPYGVEALTEVLSERRGGVVRFTVPKRGAKEQLLATAHENAVGALQQYKLKRTADYVARTQAMHDVQEALGLPEAPLRIECFDISHLGGTGIVGSMVVFEDGLPKKSQYRRFNIASARDDTDAMDQVLRRRLKHLDQDAGSLAAEAEAQQNPNAPKFAYRPQLLLIDGGLPQVNAAQRALDASGVSGIAIAGLAKRLEELWLPGEEFPVILPRNSEALFLLQRLRDEAHRFAITAQRNSRAKALGTSLDAIPGLGPARVQALLTQFGSVKRLAAANEDEISSVPGIGVETARRILAALR
ncbi:excinuclease ABC subunit UvrC [Pseudoclavibacter alba]|uniref:UvrABC system protein C n=1 Tax=Pseudoclavibacter albus TaxID=272241 RepID=A0ABT2HV60_9MICO|nr:excinuclease ABC subunit UvrC [Pseudoclavibacter alba]MBN6777990.1 excinuclease ABC subunit UvrC [Pseudoclavibacter alba]MCT2042015.1 excinuclease ABC subunit UvrC [Pseudoclavibacter alba]